MFTRFLFVGLITLSGCAHGATDLPVCDGTVRRSANPHGSVLTPDTPPVAQPVPTAPNSTDGGCA